MPTVFHKQYTLTTKLYGSVLQLASYILCFFEIFRKILRNV